MKKTCACGNDKFYTTKTVHHNLNVTLDDDGIIDSEVWEESDYQPDYPYGSLICTKCDKTYDTVDEIGTKRTLKTTLHYYKFNLEEPDQREAYNKLLENELKDRRTFLSHYSNTENERSLTEKIKSENGKDVFLETEHLFKDQWNATNGLRLMEWEETIYPNRNFKEGYYLDITDEMEEIRNTTFKCGYCGKYHDPKKIYCDSCFGSPYLRESNLPLLILSTISGKRKPLDVESNLYKEIKSKWINAQVECTNENVIAKKTEEVVDEYTDEYAKVTEKAKNKRDGWLWLLDRCINVENCIYYDHTETFSFGWRNKLNKAIADELEYKLKNFPYKYEIKVEK